MLINLVKRIVNNNKNSCENIVRRRQENFFTNNNAPGVNIGKLSISNFYNKELDKYCTLSIIAQEIQMISRVK